MKSYSPVTISEYYTNFSMLIVWLWCFLPTYICYLLDWTDMSITYWWVISIVGLIWHMSHWWQTESQIMNIEKQIGQLKNTEQTNIVDILEQIESINTNLNEILKLQESNLTKIINFFQSNEVIYLKLQEYIQTLLNILLNLSSDLSIRLTEQQKILEWAKSEVEKNIQWTTALEQVSEAQKLRLDKQIEQFAELQRVLVKV